MYPTDLPPNFYREEWEEGEEVYPYGPVSWRRKNGNVQLTEVFKNEIERLILNLKKKELQL